MSIHKELRLLPRRDHPASDKITTDDGVLYLKYTNGKPELFLRTTDGGAIQLTQAGTSPIGSSVPGASVDNAVALWDGIGGNALKQTTNVIIDGTTINSAIPIAIGADPAASGAVRLTNNEAVSSKDTGGTSYDILSLNSVNFVTLGNDSISAQLRSSSVINVVIAGILRAQFNAAGLAILQNDIQFSDTSATAPHIYQGTKSAAGTGDLFTINAQDSSAVSGTGGSIIIRAGDGTNTGSIGGDIDLRPGDGVTTDGVLTLQDGTATDRIQIGSTGSITLNGAAQVLAQVAGGNVWRGLSDSVEFFKSLLYFTSVTTSPIIYQNDEASATTGQTLTVHAQDLITATGTKTGGGLTLRAGNSSGGTSNTGGTVTIIPGTGSTAHGEVRIQDGSGNNRFRIDASNITYIDAASDIRFTHGGTLALRVLNSGSVHYTSLFSFANTTVNPTINIAADTVSTSADGLAIASQDLTTATGTKTAGLLSLRAGDCSGGTSNQGGQVNIRSGNGDGTTTAGGFYLSAGSGASGISILSMTTPSNSLILGGTLGGGSQRPNITYDANTSHTWQIAATTKVSLSAGVFQFESDVSTVRWSSAVSAPTLIQNDITTAGVSGQTFTIHAQDSTGAGTKAGGNMFIRGGNASGGTDTGGDAIIQAGLGDGGLSDGSVILNSADGYARFTVTAFACLFTVPTIAIADSVSNPSLLQANEETLTASEPFTIAAQTNTVNGGTGGNLILTGGAGTNATAGSGGDLLLDPGSGTGAGVDGNVAIFAAGTSPSWNSMERGMFLGNATTVPAGNPTSGLYVYAEGGAGKARGSSGTTTTWAPAEPHCPTCGRDCAVEWKNDKEGWELAVCMWCVTDTINAGIIKKEQK